MLHTGKTCPTLCIERETHCLADQTFTLKKKGEKNHISQHTVGQLLNFAPFSKNRDFKRELLRSHSKDILECVEVA